MTIGIGDGTTTCTSGPGDQTNRNYLYVVYMQFGGPTAEEQADSSAGGYMNGELYLAVSNNQGDLWSAPSNLTNTKSPNCVPYYPDVLTCASEHWASIAKTVDDIHIFYIQDSDAGSALQGEGAWATNRAMYLRLPGGGVNAPYLCPDEMVTCLCVCEADPNCDGEVNVLDVVTAVDVGFRNGPALPDPEPLCPRERTDVDCDGDTDVMDVVRFVNVAFRNEDPAAQLCGPCSP